MPVRLAAEPFDSDGYIFETRWNGLRAIATLTEDTLRLHNRRLGDVGARFPELRSMLHSAAELPLILDGEIVMVDGQGRPDFDALQRRLGTGGWGAVEAGSPPLPACYLATDVLLRGGRWLLREPLHRRKRALSEALRQSDCVYLAESFDTEGRALFQAAVDSGLEGIVAKPRDSVYTPGGFGGGWLAVGGARQELVIGGYSMQIAGGARTIDLLLGRHQPAGPLVYAASVRPPDREPLRSELFAVLNSQQIDQSPFAEAPPFIACWVRPELVVTVSFSSHDGDPDLRPPLFERIRTDIAPDECLLPGDVPEPQGGRPEPRPQLTLFTTLPLPLTDAPASLPYSRPPLRLLGAQ